MLATPGLLRFARNDDSFQLEMFFGTWYKSPVRFPPSFLDEIKARLPVSEVVRRRVKLMRAGREWKGLSPFTPEKTPSFFANDQKKAWFDFSAGKNGNIFDFLMETEGLSFSEAVERLAQEAGLPLPKISPEEEAKEKVRASLYEVLELAAAHFSARLLAPEGREPRAYLESRGISDEMRARFRLGYAMPQKYGLRDQLAAKGVAVQAMIDAGLLIHGDDIAVPYDRFRDRLMFPICDSGGRVIAFGGRAMATDGQPKYLNSPETALFHKGAILYNHHNARKPARENSPLIVVEGYIDVISMTSAGFEATVAPLGAALTAEHCALLWQMAEEPVLCFDGDRAGRRAAYRAADMALPLIGPGRSLRFALLPEGQDPDDFARTGGREAVSELLARALPLSRLIFLRETENKDFGTPERRAALTRRLNEIATGISDIDLRTHYRQEFKEQCFRLFRRPADPSLAKARSLDVSAPALFRARPGQERACAAPGPVSISLAASPLFRTGSVGLSPREGLILLLLVNHPGLLLRYAEELAELTFRGKAQALRDAMVVVSAGLSGAGTQGAAPGAAVPDPSALRTRLESLGFAPVLQKIDDMAAHGSHWYVKASAAEADAEEVLKQALSLHRRAKALHKELQLAELALVTDCNEANLSRLRDIQAQLSALGGMEAARDGFGAQSRRPGTTF